MVEISEHIGQKFKEQRRRLGLSQFELAELVGIHEKQVYRIETGINTPSITTAIKILHALKMDIRVLDFENCENFNPIKDEIYSLLAKSPTEELILIKNIIQTIQSTKNLSTKEKEKIERQTKNLQSKISD